MNTTTSTRHNFRPLSFAEASFAWDAFVPKLDDEQAAAFESNIRALVAEGKTAEQAISETVRDAIVFAFESDAAEDWRDAARAAWGAILSGSWRPAPETTDPLAENALASRAFEVRHAPRDRHGAAEEASVTLSDPLAEFAYDAETGAGKIVLR